MKKNNEGFVLDVKNDLNSFDNADFFMFLN